ncbi:MAG: hypothetical protein ACKOAD_08850 [Gammaproteobacteria bacterium]
MEKENTMPANNFLQELGLHIDQLIENFEMLKLELDDYKLANQDLESKYRDQKEINNQLRNQIDDMKAQYLLWEQNINGMLKKFTKTEVSMGLNKPNIVVQKTSELEMV